MLGLVVSLASLAAATPAVYNARPYAQLARRQASYGNASHSSLQVDLGYSVYQGFSNASAGIDNYYGYDRKPAEGRAINVDTSQTAFASRHRPPAISGFKHLKHLR